MKVVKISSRDEYFDIQIKRSRQKYAYCKVNVFKVKLFHDLLKPIMSDMGPILCLGTRNGREIDLFRNVFFNNKFIYRIIRTLEVSRLGYNSKLPFVEGFFRSNLYEIDEHSAVGVELNPDAKRQDTWIGSFDEMPPEWSNKFSILYSNSFDQSQDPVKTANEWMRVMKEGGVLILGFNDKKPIETNPVGNLIYTDLTKLFGGELIYFNKYENNYSYAIIRI